MTIVLRNLWLHISFHMNKSNGAVLLPILYCINCVFEVNDPQIIAYWEAPFCTSFGLNHKSKIMLLITLPILRLCPLLLINRKIAIKMQKKTTCLYHALLQVVIYWTQVSRVYDMLVNIERHFFQYPEREVWDCIYIIRMFSWMQHFLISWKLFVLTH